MDDQPRDENGRFASAGGGEGLKAWAGRSMDGHFTDARPEHLPAETWHDHYDGNPNEGGRASPERAELHREIVRDATEHVLAPAPGEQKIAVMTMGGPGSGKGSFARELDDRHFVKVDPDDVKGRLPEYREGVEHRWTGAAASAHEESSHVAKQIQSEAIRQGKHLLIDGTGKTLSSFQGKIDSLKAAGYEVHVKMSHVDVEHARERVQERAEKTGRVVPSKMLEDAYKSIPKNFREISRAADRFQVRDNRGSSPKVVWEKDASGEHHHDEAFVRAFKAQHWKE